MRFSFILIIYIYIFDSRFSQSTIRKESIIYRNHFIDKNFSINAFEESFDEFKLVFGKFYTSDEQTIRKSNFIKSIKYIVEHNKLFANGSVKHQLGINQFLDKSISESVGRESQKKTIKSSRTPYNSLKHRIRVRKTDQIFDLPLNFDWRQLNKVTKVKDQQNCNSCYAFTVTATIESAIAIKNNLTIDLSKTLYLTENNNINGVTLDLSEQQIVDCTDSGKYHNDGCNYGYIEDTYQYVIDNGLVSDDQYPYEDKQMACQYKSDQNRTYIYKFISLSHPNEQKIRQTVYNYGPVIALINDRGFDFLFYKSGIITGNKTTTDEDLNHAVTIVGFGQQNYTNYWIIKNSWSEKWGQDGFAKIESGVRGINSYIYYPILFDTNEQISDIYSNVLIIVFIIIAIGMLAAIIVFYILCCNKRGKCVYCKKIRVPKFSNNGRENLIRPDLLQNSHNIERF